MILTIIETNEIIEVESYDKALSLGYDKTLKLENKAITIFNKSNEKTYSYENAEEKYMNNLKYQIRNENYNKRNYYGL